MKKYFKIKLEDVFLVASLNILYLWRKWPQNFQHENFKMRLMTNSYGGHERLLKYKYFRQFKQKKLLIYG